MDKTYNHALHEQRIYRLWEKSNVFSPGDWESEANNQRPHFSIIMPPPNANDPLHIGHAMFVAIEDALVRYHRMKGDDVVWIPGTDHAGIETQFVFEKKLAKKGQSRFNFDRETLYQMIMGYVKENSQTAISQMKRLGASADWTRTRFTLDEKVVSFVNKTFQKLYNDGLIYRDQKLVHYCTKCGTSYSDLEVIYIEQTSSLFTVKYRLVEKSEDFVKLVTTRPELIFADTHLAVHPNNPKTKHLMGKKVLNPLTDQEMEIIADDFVDVEFGTGIVKLTPAHDFVDFEVAHRHNLPINQVVDTRGKIMPSGGKYAGLNITQARQQVVADLIDKKLITESEIKKDYQNRIGTCYRCGRVLETLPLPQFFVKVRDENVEKSLVDQVLKTLDDKKTIIHGTGREKILRNWLESLKDWNISRQIVWGIRMPVWYSIAENPDLEVNFLDKQGAFVRGILKDVLKKHSIDEVSQGLQQITAPQTAKFIISLDNPNNLTTQKSTTTNRNQQQLITHLQETDTFDTWFSSSQWPVVTLKTGERDDFDRFYPTSVMETAYDILLFWVMRMMMMGIYLTGQTPFTHVYLHGLVRDEKGQKMSKSKGNVTNPIDLVDKYGADALRMALVMSSTPGKDSSVGENKVKGMRNFSNKIWNAARFVKMNDQNQTNTTDLNSQYDREFLTKILQIEQKTHSLLDRLKIGQAAELAHNEFWHWYCDVCIEDAKSEKISPVVLRQGLVSFLKLLHPFMPFVTEAVWQEMLEDIKLSNQNSPDLLAQIQNN